jgi:hypothetical protein
MNTSKRDALAPPYGSPSELKVVTLKGILFVSLPFLFIYSPKLKLSYHFSEIYACAYSHKVKLNEVN